MDQLKQELEDFFMLCIQSITTPQRAIRNNYLSVCPGLTVKLISKHLLQNTATNKGRINQEQMKLQSTKTIKESIQDFTLLQEDNNICTNDIMCAIFDTEDTVSKSYSD